MPCEHPIWIRNRRYYSKKFTFSENIDVYRSSLAIQPWDVARKYLMVPCGKCPDCLRRLRNDWYVRLERELAYCRDNRIPSHFLTITINPKYYDQALINPSAFIRKWLERLRHGVGHSFKHAFFQEFGTHPKTLPEPRLHFHGFLFGLDISYEELRRIIGDLGFIWISYASHKRARYCVKYVCKQINVPESVANSMVTYEGKRISLSNLLSHRRYARKFVSPHMGDYLGVRSCPSDRVSTWDYMDFKKGVVYTYQIPRYYDKYLKPEDKLLRSLRSADLYSRFCGSSLVRRFVTLFTKSLLPPTSLSYRNKYSWLREKFLTLTKAGTIPTVDLPLWIDFDIVQAWKDFYKIDVQPLLTKFLIKWQNNLTFLMR